MLLDGGVGIQKRSAGDGDNPDFPFVAGRSLKGKSRQRAWRSTSSASLGAELCQMKPSTHDNNFCSHNYKCFATRSRQTHTQNVVAQLRYWAYQALMRQVAVGRVQLFPRLK
jgi:hypothetical protein